MGLFLPPAYGKEITVDNLEKSQVGQFPSGWKTYPFHKNKASRVYQVQENSGEKYIQAIDEDNISVPIFKDFYWNLTEYPYLTFQWRARKIPKGSKETRHESNDSACGVYVGFGRSHALKYVWSDLMTPGSYWNKKPGVFVIVSKENSSKNLNQWQTVTINVPEDYQRYFFKPPSDNPNGIGIMTDGNALKQPSACDYRNFTIASKP